MTEERKYKKRDFTIKKGTLKERMFELAKTINFRGNNSAKEMFLNNIKSAENWSITRNRFWGAPIPIWRMKYKEPPKKILEEIKTQNIDILSLYQIGEYSGMYYNLKTKELQAVFGSIKDLELFFRDDYIIDFINNKNSGKYLHFKQHYTKEMLKKTINEYGYENVFINNFVDFYIDDLHRPYIDELVKHMKTGDMKRCEDVLDCWFESGSMPYAQVHYPFDFKVSIK